MQANAVQSTETGFAHPTNGLHPAEDGLDPSADMDAHVVADMAGGSAFNGRAFAFSGHMGRDVPFPEFVHEARAVIALVGADGGNPSGSTQVIDHLYRRIHLSGTVRRGHLLLGNEAAAVVHQHVPQIGEAGGVSCTFLVQAHSRVRRRDMGVIAPLLSPEVCAIPVPIAGSFGLKGFLGRPCLQLSVVSQIDGPLVNLFEGPLGECCSTVSHYHSYSLPLSNTSCAGRQMH